MIVNRYPGKCQSCEIKLAQGDGFAYKNGHRWFSVCNSAACHRKLGLKPPTPEAKIERKIDVDGKVTMPYDRDAIPLLRSMPGARWNPEEKVWTVSTKKSDLPRVIEIADQIGLEVTESFRKKADEGTEESRAAAERAEKTYDGKQLFDYQKEGVKFLSLRKRALLADDMGLGKTVQALMALPEGASVILCCPAAVKYNWSDEVQMWRSEFEVVVCKGRDGFVLPKPGQIVICNYDILPPWLSPTKDSGKRTQKGDAIKVAPLTDEQKDILSKTRLICDECHLSKNYKAARSKKVTQLSRACHSVWFLTGTPLMNRPTDLFGVLQSGDMGDILGSWYKFVKLFNGYKNQWGGYEFGMPTDEVPERMKRVMLRRLKSEVLTQLPPKTYKKIEIDDIGGKLQKQLEKFVKKQAEDEGWDSSKLDIQALVDKLHMSSLPNFDEFSKIRAMLAESRIPAMIEVVQSYEDSDTPLVVFSAHKKPIKTLEEREGWKIITGDTKPEDRRNIVKSFQDGKLKGIGLTIQAGGVGLTLTHASNALFVDLDWTPAMNIQAEDRICRIGQTSNKVLIMRMSSTHPLDQHMQNLIEYKMELAYKALEKSIQFNPTKPRPAVQDVEIIEETDEELAERIANAAAEAEREIALDKINNIIGREAAKVNETPEPELTPKRKKMLREALDYMVGVCDGAEKRDGKGFSKPDVGISRWIASTGLRDDDEVPFRLLERVLVRYRRQLKNKFEAIWKPE